MHDTLLMEKRKAEEEIKIGRCREGENKKWLVEKRIKTRIFEHEEKHRKTNKQKCKRKIEVKHCVPCNISNSYIKVNP